MDNYGGFMCHAGPGCHDCSNTWECTDTGGGCLVGDVTVATPSGPVAIADLKAGDAILSFTDAGAVVEEAVVHTQVVEAYSYLQINDNIRVTAEHPFLVGQEWVLAKDLTEGVVLAGPCGGEEVRFIRTVNRGVRVHNLTTSGNHTFIAEGVVVHNKVIPYEP